MHWIITALLWWGVVSAIACAAVVAVIVAGVVYDRVTWNRWFWDEDR